VSLSLLSPGSKARPIVYLASRKGQEDAVGRHEAMVTRLLSVYTQIQDSLSVLSSPHPVLMLMVLDPLSIPFFHSGLKSDQQHCSGLLCTASFFTTEAE